MNISKVALELTKENVLQFLTPDYIYRYYLGKKLVYNKAFSSPFRVDRNPSFMISNKTHYFTDFATGDSGDCFTFVKKLYNINFNSALKQIVYDLGIAGHFNIPVKSIKNTKKAIIIEDLGIETLGRANIRVKTRKFEPYDLEYWNCQGISLKYLKIGGIYALDYFYINGKYFKAEKYSYVYVENKDNRETYKIYQPFSKTKKWIGNNNFSVWELWNLLPQTYNKLIITSSRKDGLSIIENLHIPSTAFQSETTFPKPKVMEDVLKRFNKVYLLLDNDYTKSTNWGQQHALKLVEKYNLINIVIPDEYNSKDFSDLVCNYDRTFASNIIKNLII